LKLEWKERWIVIRDGWVYLCKERDVSGFFSCFFFVCFVFVRFLSCSSSFLVAHSSPWSFPEHPLFKAVSNLFICSFKRRISGAQINCFQTSSFFRRLDFPLPFPSLSALHFIPSVFHLGRLGVAVSVSCSVFGVSLSTFDFPHRTRLRVSRCALKWPSRISDVHRVAFVVYFVFIYSSRIIPSLFFPHFFFRVHLAISNRKVQMWWKR
jgi:hypothetical protein